MPVFSYRTIQSPSEGTYKEKGSKFLAFAYPVENESAIKEKLIALQKEYFDARHHCYAWMLGADKKSFRAFDDGEPNHSAGDPILGQIRSKDITNVLIVVIRYFGGVKLGVGGLIIAYRTAAEEALNHAQIIEKEVVEDLILTYDYGSTPEVMRLVREFDLIIRDQNFTSEGQMTVDFKLRHKTALFEKITLLNAMGVNLKMKK